MLPFHVLIHVAGYMANRVAGWAVEGSVVKTVDCERCSECYVYLLRRTGVGHAHEIFGGGKAAAQAKAHADLRQLLETETDLVPCPTCGWYQAEMIPKARRRYCRWMVTVGTCLVFAVFPIGILGCLFLDINGQQGEPIISLPTFVGILASLLLVGTGTVIAKFLLANLYDPNARHIDRVP